MIRYKGKWNVKDGHQVERDGRPFNATSSVFLGQYQPTKFAWGYVGRRSFLLAAAILFDVIGEPPVYDLTKRFERHVISRLDRYEWSLTSDQVNEWLRVVRLDSELMAPEVRPQSK